MFTLCTCAMKKGARKEGIRVVNDKKRGELIYIFFVRFSYLTSRKTMPTGCNWNKIYAKDFNHKGN